MNLLKRLQECATIGQSDPILTKLNAGPAVKKLVETAIMLSASPDEQQRNHAYSFMKSAIKELQENGTIDNHNNGSRTDGSEGSSDNEEPYSQVADESKNGEKPMQGMKKVENQFNLIGMDPIVARELAGGKMPSMGVDQQIRQMQYMLETMMNNFFKQKHNPLVREVMRLREVEKYNNRRFVDLTNELKETRSSNGSMRLDLGSMRDREVTNFRETRNTSPGNDFSTTSNMHVATIENRYQGKKSKGDTRDAQDDIIKMSRSLEKGNTLVDY